MKFGSISDIGRSIVMTNDVYNRELGSFSAFMSPERKAAFHRINMEYMQILSNKSLNDIRESMYESLKINAKILNINYQISNTLDSIAELTFNNYQQVKKTNDILKEILETLKNPNAIVANEKARLASQNIIDAKSLSEERSAKLLDESLKFLEEAISINPVDYKAHFELGWLYSFYKNDFIKAEECFDNAVIRSLNNDKVFAVFALRHLADTRQNLGLSKKALIAIQEAVDLNTGDIFQTNFEYIQHLVKDGNVSEAKKIIISIIDSDPKIFQIAITDPVLRESDSLIKSIESMKENKIKKLETSINKVINDYVYFLNLNKNTIKVSGFKRGFLGFGFKSGTQKQYTKFKIPNEIVNNHNETFHKIVKNEYRSAIASLKRASYIKLFYDIFLE